MLDDRGECVLFMLRKYTKFELITTFTVYEYESSFLIQVSRNGMAQGAPGCPWHPSLPLTRKTELGSRVIDLIPVKRKAQSHRFG